MIRVFLGVILCVVFFPLQAFSQQVEDYLAHDLLVSQRDGSSEKLKEYFSRVDLKSDTIYAVLFISGSSPRLEIQLNSFDNDLKRFCPSAETVLMSVDAEEAAAKEYNRRHAYKADHYMYDNGSGYLDFLSFNTEGPMGSYVMKIDMKGGRLICGGGLYTNEDEFFEALVSAKQPKPFFTYVKERYEEKEFALPSDVRHACLYYSDVEVEGADTDFNKLNGPPIVKDGLLIISDELSESTSCFKRAGQDSYRFIGKIELTEEEKDLYMQLDDEDTENVKELGWCFYMPLSVNFIDASHIGVSYSIPDISYEKIETDGENRKKSLAILNRPVIIVRDTMLGQCTPWEYADDFFTADEEDYVYKHFYYYPLGAGLMAMYCVKMAWPIDYFEEFNGNPEKDPFMEDFYSYDNPYMVMVDMKTGKQLFKFGHLPEVAKETMTGYYYCGGIADGDGKEMVYGTQYAGELYLAPVSAPDNVIRTYRVFELDRRYMPAPDESRFRTNEYGKDYAEFYRRCITALRLAENEIHCIVEVKMSADLGVKASEYEYVVLNRQTGKVKEKYLIGKQQPDDFVIAANLTFDKTPLPFYLCRRGDKYVVVFVDGKNL